LKLLYFEHIIPALLIAFTADLLFGDPRWLYHPVRLIGKLITGCEDLTRRIYKKDVKGQKQAGLATAAIVIAVSTLVPWTILTILYHVHFLLGFLLETFWCWQLLAAGSLRKESMAVLVPLKKGDLKGARKAVSMIVGRDTAALDADGVTRAAVETVAENASDGVIAPMLYMMIGGAVGGFLYKAVNTMDSMIGYRNERYRYFGTVAARLDDILNFLPSRFAGVLFCLAAVFTGDDFRNALRIFKRDRMKHASPNSAQTESACAGALRIRLAGDAYYFGKLHRKPTLGDPIRKIRPDDIQKANKLMITASVISLVIMTLVRLVLILLFR